VSRLVKGLIGIRVCLILCSCCYLSCSLLSLFWLQRVASCGNVRVGSITVCVCVCVLTMLTEMFLPSYIDYHFDDLERRQDPVQDIILTDEEVRNMFPSDTRL
jgi:hypothetical protein